MSKTIQLSDATFAKLGVLAIPFVDTTPEDVIKRLIEQYEANGASISGMTTESLSSSQSMHLANSPENRTPRERGATVKINGEVIHAVTVPDLYEQVLKLLFKKGYIDRLNALIPFKTSKKRYLIANEPVHPNGNDFSIPVEYKGYFMEAHKSYMTAIRALEKFLSKGGLSVIYMG